MTDYIGIGGVMCIFIGALLYLRVPDIERYWRLRKMIRRMK
jgi:hypothetical protein